MKISAEWVKDRLHGNVPLSLQMKRLKQTWGDGTNNITISSANRNLTFVPIVFIAVRIWGTIRFLIGAHFHDYAQARHSHWIVPLQVHAIRGSFFVSIDKISVISLLFYWSNLAFITSRDLVTVLRDLLTLYYFAYAPQEFATNGQIPCVPRVSGPHTQNAAKIHHQGEAKLMTIS